MCIPSAVRSVVLYARHALLGYCVVFQTYEDGIKMTPFNLKEEMEEG